MPILLAQLVDLLPNWDWTLIGIIALAMPMLGFFLSSVFHGFSGRRSVVTTVFYAAALPMYGLVLIAKTENLTGVCGFFVMIPVGILIGLMMLIPRRRRTTPWYVCARCGYDLRATPEDQSRYPLNYASRFRADRGH
jgi:hypothetical protein